MHGQNHIKFARYIFSCIKIWSLSSRCDDNQNAHCSWLHF